MRLKNHPIYSLTLLGFLFYLLSGCAEEEFISENPLPVKQSESESTHIKLFNKPDAFKAEGETQTLQFSSSSSWTASTSRDWLEVDPAQGTTGTPCINITASENPLSEERNAILYLHSGDSEKRITITQKQKKSILLTSSKAEIPTEGEDITVIVKSDIDYKYDMDADAATWIHEVPAQSRTWTTHEHHFTINANAGADKRQGKITFKGKGCSETFTVYQHGTTPGLVLTPDFVNLDWNCQQFNIELSDNSSYTMKLPMVDWLHEDSVHNMSDYTLSFSVDANSSEMKRSAVITFESEELPTQYVTVTQINPESNIWVYLTNQTVQVPLFSSKNGVDGKISWLNREEKYEAEKTLDFSDSWDENPFQSVTYEMDEVENMHIDDIRGINTIMIQ